MLCSLLGPSIWSTTWIMPCFHGLLLTYRMESNQITYSLCTRTKANPLPSWSRPCLLLTLDFHLLPWSLTTTMAFFFFFSLSQFCFYHKAYYLKYIFLKNFIQIATWSFLLLITPGFNLISSPQESLLMTQAKMHSFKSLTSITFYFLFIIAQIPQWNSILYV